MPYGEAIRYVNELRVHDGSHTQASDLGWLFPMSSQAIDARRLLVHTVNRFRDEKVDPLPFTLPWPWDEAPHSPEVIAEATARLEKKSAFHTRDE